MEVFIGWLLRKIADTAIGKFLNEHLEEKFPKLFKNRNKELLEMHERRMQEKEKEIAQRDKLIADIEKGHIKEKGHIISALKRKSLSTEKLIHKYSKPLNAILISYASQQPKAFIREELEKYNAKYLGGTTSLIPPSKVPKYVKTNKDLSRWFKRNILKGRHCKVKFTILFDLKKDAFWGTFLPYTQKSPIHRSIGDVLAVEDLFTEQDIDTIALIEIVKDGDIAWLASAVLDGQELEAVVRNQNIIEKNIGNPSLKQLANNQIQSKLSASLKKVVGKPTLVSKAIIKEAQFWEDKLA